MTKDLAHNCSYGVDVASGIYVALLRKEFGRGIGRGATELTYGILCIVIG